MNTTAFMRRLTESGSNSYAQVFFSRNRLFALLLLGVSFIDLYAGLSGLLAVVVTTVTAFLFGFDESRITSGAYGFNSLLVGLGLGIYYQPSPEFYFVVVLASLLTLFISVAMEGVIGKYYLPYLSIPFILSIWVVLLAAKQFDHLGISERGIYTLNELYGLGGQKLVNFHERMTRFFPVSLRLYFLSLAAIFFQTKIIAGILIAAGLFLYSRIAFTLSLLGFYTAYFFYLLLGVNLAETSYSYIGFNYILTAIAIGGFYLIPSIWSYGWAVLLTPLVAILTLSLDPVFAVFKVPIYALPFNIMVLLFLYVLKFRTGKKKRLTEVVIQHFSPEKNLYYDLNSRHRFNPAFLHSFRLPFSGQWTISQGHDGEYTHRDDWRHAWDFVIEGPDGKTYKNEGDLPTDYYCFGKHVLSPGYGIVETVEDGIDDNTVGEVNLIKNWGNTVIIKHAENLYSKMSHLQKGSITVKKGDTVKPGDIIGKAGNSGRSPYPHLHFQFQSTPYIGSTTLYYPFGTYLKYEKLKPSLVTYGIPARGERVANMEVNELLVQAFRFVPGQKIHFEPEGEVFTRGLTWEIRTNVYNQSYIYCTETGSRAWFRSEDNIFYFTGFEGNKRSLLYYFFLAAYRVYKGFYKEITVTDSYPLHLVFGKTKLLLQDLAAPFHVWLHAGYELKYSRLDNPVMPSYMKIETSARTCRSSGKCSREIRFSLEINEKGLSRFVLSEGKKIMKVKCTD